MPGMSKLEKQAGDMPARMKKASEGPLLPLQGSSRITGPAGTGKWPEARLYELLKQVSADRRRALLVSSFSEAQRLRLEQWMVSQPDLRKPASARDGSASSSKDAGLDPALEPSSPRPPRNKKDSETAGLASSQKDAAALPGVHCRCYAGRRLYRAYASIGPFSVTSRYDHQLSTAVRFQQVLTAVRETVLLAQPEEVEEAFKRAIIEEPRKWGLSSRDDMGLCFSAGVSAKHWVGRCLFIPRFRVCDLDIGLKAWRRLREARQLVYCGQGNGRTLLRHHSAEQLEAAWQAMREAYVTAWTEGGHSRNKVEARVKAWYAAQQHKADSKALSRPPAPLSAEGPPGPPGAAAGAAKQISDRGYLQVRLPRRPPKRSGTERRIQKLLRHWQFSASAGKDDDKKRRRDSEPILPRKRVTLFC